MIQTDAVVIEKETIAPAWWRLTIAAPDLAPKLRPGQFLLLRCGNHFTCYLRRPIFPQPHEDDQLSVLLRPDVDPGLAWLSARQVGDRLDIIGPLGTGFNLPAGIQNLLLVSDSQMIAPLLGQMEEGLGGGLAVTLALGSSRAAGLYPLAALPPAVEFQAATLDGSAGHQGPVTDLLPNLLRWADIVCAVGSTQLYQTLIAQAVTTRFRVEPGFAYGLTIEYPIACGVGACLGCAMATKTGVKLICVDGPVVDLTMLVP